MSAWRQQRKPVAMAALAGLILSLAVPPASRAATTERIVTDPNRGLALSGFDPVAYFTDARPLLGRNDVELTFGGAVWRFRNEGNRAAFARHPEVYLPVFGGHDPVGIARGVARPGHPEIWLIVGERLYLFYNAEARKAFAAAPEATAGEAERKWPEVMRSIAP
jgi:hypothetical protein